MAFVTTLHLQASADAALSCKPGRPVTIRGHGLGQSHMENQAEQHPYLALNLVFVKKKLSQQQC